MKFTTLTASVLTAIFLPRILAEDVTLCQFGGDPASQTESIIREAHSVGITPVSVVAQSGETIYVGAEAYSKAYYTNSLRTVTLVPSPTTVTYTFRADASRYHLSLETTVNGAKGTREDDCTIDVAAGKMVCALKVVGSNSQTAITVATTSTGTPAPWYTVSNVENLSLPTVSSGALPKAHGGEGVARMFAMAGVPVLGMLAGALLL